MEYFIFLFVLLFAALNFYRLDLRPVLIGPVPLNTRPDRSDFSEPLAFIGGLIKGIGKVAGTVGSALGKVANVVPGIGAVAGAASAVLGAAGSLLSGGSGQASTSQASGTAGTTSLETPAGATSLSSARLLGIPIGWFLVLGGGLLFLLFRRKRG